MSAHRHSDIDRLIGIGCGIMLAALAAAPDTNRHYLADDSDLHPAEGAVEVAIEMAGVGDCAHCLASTAHRRHRPDG